MCMNSVVEVNSPFASPGLVSPLGLADLVVWLALAAWLSLGVFPLLGTASAFRKLVLGIGIGAALVTVGLWAALAPVAAGVLANAPTCTLS
ncbi:MAG TPA: hypothetical protein VGE37_02120, partial [Archangium sp.]